MIRTKELHSGFILPTVLLLSIAIVTIMVTILTVTTSSFGGNYVDHYQRLSDEAAEAGSAYATACLNLSEHVQTWGPSLSRPNLTPNSDCNGANTYPTNTYIYSDSTVRTYFSVGNLDYTAAFSAQISAIGYAEVLRPNGTIEKTYTSMQKKVITWPTDISGQMSASGTNRTCAIVTSQVYCWGFNRYGQLGNGQYLNSGSTEDAAPTVDSKIPVKVLQQPGVLAGKKIVKIFVAQHHSCALSDDGKMYCWGINSDGQLGNDTTTNLTPAVPIQVGGALAGKVVTDIGGTFNTSCAIAESKIYCWGNNSKGTTGVGLTSGDTDVPTLVTATNLPVNYVATELSTSGSRSRTMCAIVNTKAYCWGDNDSGAVGDGTTTDRTMPTKVVDTGVLSGKTVTEISAEGYVGDENASDGTDIPGPHVCVIANGALYCWGENSDGQLGDNTSADKFTPVAVIASGVLAGKTIQDVKLGIYHTCALASGGVYCWGRDNYGQVGDGGTGAQASKDVPIQVTQEAGKLTASNVIAIGAGANRGCAVVTDGRTFCWGLNSSGQIGDGTTTNAYVPTESLFLRPLSNQYIF
jgi:Alpha-tubulin suppressor and related RCC1 domain-containing proteins